MSDESVDFNNEHCIDLIDLGAELPANVVSSELLSPNKSTDVLISEDPGLSNDSTATINPIRSPSSHENTPSHELINYCTPATFVKFSSHPDNYNTSGVIINSCPKT